MNIKTKKVPNLPLSWDFLKDYTNNPLDYEGILRNPQITINYDTMIENKSLEDRTNEMINLLGFTPNSSEMRLFKFLENNYPYDVDKNIKQLVLFINPFIEHMYQNKSLIEYIVKIKAKELGFKDYLYFQQPVERRSLPTITHYHVFLK